MNINDPGMRGQQNYRTEFDFYPIGKSIDFSKSIRDIGNMSPLAKMHFAKELLKQIDEEIDRGSSDYLNDFSETVNSIIDQNPIISYEDTETIFGIAKRFNEYLVDKEFEPPKQPVEKKTNSVMSYLTGWWGGRKAEPDLKDKMIVPRDEKKLVNPQKVIQGFNADEQRRNELALEYKKLPEIATLPVVKELGRHEHKEGVIERKIRDSFLIDNLKSESVNFTFAMNAAIVLFGRISHSKNINSDVLKTIETNTSDVCNEDRDVAVSPKNIKNILEFEDVKNIEQIKDVQIQNPNLTDREAYISNLLQKTKCLEDVAIDSSDSIALGLIKANNEYSAICIKNVGDDKYDYMEYHCSDNKSTLVQFVSGDRFVAHLLDRYPVNTKFEMSVINMK